MKNDPKKWVAIQDELLVFFPYYYYYSCATIVRLIYPCLQWSYYIQLYICSTFSKI
jgi:hypothetical protein